MLIGRSRVGKSTIRTLLVDPTMVPEELTLKSGTKDPIFESFHVAEKETVLNIIDTPGLFERGVSKDVVRDNPAILKTINVCVTREITKFHFICFCISIPNGINQQDIESLELLIKIFGKELSRNSCLIVTHCELKNETQLEDIRKQLLEDSYFKNIAGFFEQGIYFSGSINRDDYNQGNNSIVRQYKIIDGYRSTLIRQFTTDIEPFQINQTLIKEILNLDGKQDIEQEKLKNVTRTQANTIAELKKEHETYYRYITQRIQELEAENSELLAQLDTSKKNETFSSCNPS